MRQYGFKESMRLSKFSFPAGLLVPLALLFLTFGYLKFIAITVFEVTVLPRIRSFAKISELQLSLIALGGIIANLLVSFAFFLGGLNEFAKMNLYFAFFNLIPFSDLDGSKILFGSRLLWVFSFIFISSLMILFEISGLLTTLLSALIIALIVLVFYYLSYEN